MKNIKKNTIKKILVGFIAGIICGLFTSGGGLILVPAFIYMLKMEPKKARATSIFCILPMVAVSAFFYGKSNLINWTAGILCAIGGIVRKLYRSKIIKQNTRKIFKSCICNFFNICRN